mmetsp:Transcript_29745/g.58425  ORF Transcript_29745/g.58425 Transcript_29745/m.58425 type:complete len:245 (-) Transcript_29745:1051-1785(-)
MAGSSPEVQEVTNTIISVCIERTLDNTRTVSMGCRWHQWSSSKFYATCWFGGILSDRGPAVERQPLPGAAAAASGPPRGLPALRPASHTYAVSLLPHRTNGRTRSWCHSCSLPGGRMRMACSRPSDARRSHDWEALQSPMQVAQHPCCRPQQPVRPLGRLAIRVPPETHRPVSDGREPRRGAAPEAAHALVTGHALGSGTAPEFEIVVERVQSSCSRRHCQICQCNGHHPKASVRRQPHSPLVC